jgi:transcriptional regulator with XRE-family HTH domain
MDMLRFGRQFRALRIRLERRQQDVADAARLSRSLVASVDRGQLSGVTIGAIVRAAAALGADVDLRLRWRGEALDRLLDEDHAAIVETVVRRLVTAGWQVALEVSFSIWGERGSIDVLGWHPATGALLVVEVKSVVPDSQATNHGLDRKARIAPQLARERGWRVRHVSRLLVVGDGPTSRRRVARLSATYDVSLPARGSIVRRWLRDPSAAIAGILFVAFGSHKGIRRARRGRERVRRPKQAQMTTTAERGAETAEPTESGRRKAFVAVE